MKRNYSDAHLKTLQNDETAIAYHWVRMSIPAWNGYISAIELGETEDNVDECVCDYLECLQRERYDIDMPRFSVSRVDLARLYDMVAGDPEGV